jgi:hypothetical protein
MATLNRSLLNATLLSRETLRKMFTVPTIGLSVISVLAYARALTSC